MSRVIGGLKNGWILTQKGNRDKFESWSYQNTKKYINRMVDLIRSEGVTQPIVWNCGWPKLIQKNKAAFNAIADSKVDAVSFCLYPGQSDLKKPFWKNTEELSDQELSPYIKIVQKMRIGLVGYILIPLKIKLSLFMNMRLFAIKVVISILLWLNFFGQ